MCKRSVSKLFENFGGTLGRKRAVSWANIITKGLSWVFGELATTRRCVNQQPTCTLSPCPSNRLCHWGWGWWFWGGLWCWSFWFYLLLIAYLHLSLNKWENWMLKLMLLPVSCPMSIHLWKAKYLYLWYKVYITLLVCNCCTSLKICVHRWTACIPTRSNNKMIQHHPINVFRQELWSYLPSESIENPYFAPRWF